MSERYKQQDPNKRERGIEQREGGEQVGMASGAVQVNSAKPFLYIVRGQPASESWIDSAEFRNEEALEMLLLEQFITE